jgi:hypothetical protein
MVLSSLALPRSNGRDDLLLGIEDFLFTREELAETFAAARDAWLGADRAICVLAPGLAVRRMSAHEYSLLPRAEVHRLLCSERFPKD